MKNRLLIGAALTASLLLSACGGDTTGTATTSSTTSSTSATSSSSSATTSESMESMDSSAMETMETSSDDASSTVTPVTLDEQSVAWFTGFCTAVKGVQGSMESSMTAQPDAASTPQEQQATLAAGFTTAADGLKTAGAQISALPAPTVEGGEAAATAIPAAFTAVGEAFGTAAQTFGSATVTDTASLQAAYQTLQTDITTSLSGLETAFSGLDTTFGPGVEEAAAQIPECEGVAGA